MSEKAKSIVDIMKEKISASGQKKGNTFWVKKDGSVRVRFLSDLNEAVYIKFHELWKVVDAHPCLEYYGKACPHCDSEEVKTTERYCLTVWNYETKKRELFIYKMNKWSPFPALVSYYGEYDTICDRDYKIEKHGEGSDVSYAVVPLGVKEFIGEEVPFSKKQVFKKVLEMFPYVDKDVKLKKTQEDDDDEDDEDDEEVVIPKTKRAAQKVRKAVEEDEEDEEDDEDDEDEKPVKKAKPKNRYDEDDEDDEDDFEDELDFKSMSGDELKRECKKRGFDYKGRTRKEVIAMLVDDVPF